MDGFMVDDFEILGPANPAGLPVEASPLTGMWSGADVALSWNTFREQNNDGFEIQRSTDGMNFSPIGFVDGAGSSSTTRPYSYIDMQPSGSRIFYRYLQRDLDGGQEFSNMVEMIRPEGGVLSIDKIYPNPFTDELNVRFGEVYPSGGDLSIIDVSGRVIFRQTLESSADHVLTLSEPWLKAGPGVYFIRVRYDGEVKTSKVVKM